MRIPKLNKALDSEQSRSDDNFSCLFCSHQVKNTNLSRYENHLVQRHNLEKHIQQTILDTFNGKARNLDKKNEELFSMKYIKDAMESIEKINKEKIKGTFKKVAKEKCEDPFKDLIDFVEQTEKEMALDNNVKNVEVKTETNCSDKGDDKEEIEENSTQPTTEESVDYRCKKCDKTFDRGAKLKFHVKNVHTEDTKNAESFSGDEKVEKFREEERIIEGVKEDVHEWAEFLIFECKVCWTKMPSTMYPDHLLTWHSLSLADYQKKTGDNDHCSPAEYQCLVCIQKVPWQKSSMIDHLLTHKLTPDQYKVIFEKAIMKQIHKQTEMIKRGEDSSSPKVGGAQLPNIDLEETSEENFPIEKKVECTFCQKEFSTNFKLQRHLKTDHCNTVQESNLNSPKNDTFSAKDVKAEPNELEVVDKKFKCQICREEFLWCDSKIKDHLSQKHCLTKDFYFTLYEKSYEEKGKESPSDKFTCKLCTFSSSRKMALTNHTKKYHEPGDEVSCCKETLLTKWEVFVHLMENHKDKNKELFNKFQVWPGLEKYYTPK